MPSARTPSPPADTRPTDATSDHPSWLAWLIALVPLFPPLYVVALRVLGRLRELPKAVRIVLVVFAATQVVAALFTPHPLLSVPLAAGRSVLILSMIAAGIYLRDSRRLRPLVWGYLGVFATAWVFSFATTGWEALLSGRLAHPLYYFVSLGLLATIALWLIVSWKGGSPWWRFPAGALALVTLLASGSRGPLLALAIGAFAAVLAGSLRQLRTLGLLVVVIVAAFGLIPGLRDVLALERLLTFGLSGRDQVWEGALRAFLASPVGGQGPYQIGSFLGFLYSDPCMLTPALEQAGVQCPDWLARFRGAWLIAHNVFLHSLAETGIVGTAGLTLLFATAARATWRARNGLLLSVFWGFMAMNLVDVVTAVPSPHFSELFWVVVGMAFVQSEQTTRDEVASG